MEVPREEGRLSMEFVEINWRPGPGELRKFGRALIAGFGCIGFFFFLKDAYTGGWQVWSLGALPSILWIGGGAAGLLALSGTRSALPLYWAWMGIAYAMGNMMSRLFLMLLYYGMITPMGIIMRFSGRDKLTLRRGRRQSYWHDVPSTADKSRYERQF